MQLKILSATNGALNVLKKVLSEAMRTWMAFQCYIACDDYSGQKAVVKTYKIFQNIRIAGQAVVEINLADILMNLKEAAMECLSEPKNSRITGWNKNK